jgi:hypothetical protein
VGLRKQLDAPSKRLVSVREALSDEDGGTGAEKAADLVCGDS